jgi:hypothetical protein
MKLIIEIEPNQILTSSLAQWWLYFYKNIDELKKFSICTNNIKQN